jgi:hypothetical protein
MGEGENDLKRTLGDNGIKITWSTRDLASETAALELMICL